MSPSLQRASVFSIAGVFLLLGLTAFGGPIAHLAYFRDVLVERRRWLEESEFARVIALCQVLPGPTSSQVAYAVGLQGGGLLGGLAAWTAFTAPSAVLMLLLAMGFQSFDLGEVGAGLIHGLKLAAVAIVAQAVLVMADRLARGWRRACVALACAVIAAIAPQGISQLAALGVGAMAGLTIMRSASSPLASTTAKSGVLRPLALASGFLMLLLLGLAMTPLGGFAGAFYRSGALVFGGGHVVLPLLEEAVVAPGWVGDQAFLSGYGVAQAMPGPLFSFAAYLGALSSTGPGGVVGAALAMAAISAPGLLAVTAALPFWERVVGEGPIQATVAGLNAAVVGILATAFVFVVLPAAVASPADGLAAIAAILALVLGRAPSVLIVALLAAFGAILSLG